MKRKLVEGLIATCALLCSAAVWTRFVAGPMTRGAVWGSKLGHSQADYQATRERAAAIIAALERWKTAHAGYPVTLEELAPSQLPKIDQPLVGKGVWEYGRRNDSFELGFFVGPSYESDTYDSAKGEWVVDR